MPLPAHTPAPAGLGTKFWPDGSYRRFPGNTVVAMVTPGSPAWTPSRRSERTSTGHSTPT